MSRRTQYDPYNDPWSEENDGNTQRIAELLKREEAQELASRIVLTPSEKRSKQIQHLRHRRFEIGLDDADTAELTRLEEEQSREVHVAEESRKAAFAAIWTMEGFIERRARWNKIVQRYVDAKVKKMDVTEVEREAGFTLDDLKRAKQFLGAK